MCSWKGLSQGVRGCCSHPQRSVAETSNLIVPKNNSFNSYFLDITNSALQSYLGTWVRIMKHRVRMVVVKVVVVCILK